jgi:hypothetical protein
VESKEVGFSLYLARCLCLIYSSLFSLLETFSDVEQSKQFLGGSMTECRDNIVVGFTVYHGLFFCFSV